MSTNILQVTNLSDLKQIMKTRVTVILGLTTPHTSKELKVIVRKFLKRKSEIFPLITFVYMEVSDDDRQTLNILRGNIASYPKIYHIRDGNNIILTLESATEDDIYESFGEVEHLYINEMNQFNNKNNTGKNTGKNKEADNDTEISIKDDSENPGQEQRHDQTKVQTQTQAQTQGSVNMKIPTETETAPINPQIEKKKNIEKLILLNKKSNELVDNFIDDISKRKKMEEHILKKNPVVDKETAAKEYRKSLRKIK